VGLHRPHRTPRAGRDGNGPRGQRRRSAAARALVVGAGGGAGPLPRRGPGGQPRRRAPGGRGRRGMNAPARSAPPREARQFDAALERHGRRRRWRRFAEGAALAVITAAAALLAAVLVMDQYRFADESVRAARVLFYTALAAGLAGFLLPRLVARTDRKRLAAAIEARDPEFDAMLVSAVEARERYGSAAASPALQARLMAGAAGRLDTERRVAGEE